MSKEMSLRHLLMWSAAMCVVAPDAGFPANAWPGICRITKPCPTPASGFTFDASTQRYEVNNICNLEGIQNGLSRNYELIHNIDATCSSSLNGGQGFKPIAGTFSGSLEGNGFAINGLSIQSSSLDVGLFQYIGVGSGVFVDDLALTNVTVVDSSLGTDNVGTIAAVNFGGTLTSLYVTGVISAPKSAYVGGILGSNVGPNNGALISRSYASVEISGGVAGTDIGGLVGGNDAPISYSFANGLILSGYNAGGIAGGTAGNGTVTASVSTGTVVGYGIPGNSTAIGGLVGLSGGPAISSSYATGAVSGGSNSLVGGLVGANQSGLIQQTYSAGPVGMHGSYIGGFIGWEVPQTAISSSFWDTTTSGLQVGAGLGSQSGLTGETTSQFKSFLPYGLFSGVWSDGGGVSYPYIEMPILSSSAETQLASAFRPPLAQFAAPAILVPPYANEVFAPVIATSIPAGQLQFFQYDPTDINAASNAPEACLATVYTMIARLIGQIHSEAQVGNRVPGYNNSPGLCNISSEPASQAHIDCLFGAGGGFFPASLGSYVTFTPILGPTIPDVPLGSANSGATLSACLTIPTPAGDSCAEVLVASGRPLSVHGMVPSKPNVPPDHWMLATSIIKALPNDPSAAAGTVIRLVANDPELGQQVFIDMNPRDGIAYHRAVLNPTGKGIASSYGGLTGFWYLAEGYKYASLH